MAKEPESEVNEKLWKAVKQGDEHDVRQLLQSGDPSYKSAFNIRGLFPRQGTSLLMVASHNGQKSIVKLLLEHGAHVNNANQSEQTALHYASWQGHHEIVRLLVKSNADIHAEDMGNETALHLASKYGHFETARVLINLGANVHSVNKYDKTSLHLAADKGYDRIVQLLVQNKAKINVQDEYGDTPLHHAARKNHDGIMNILKAKKANPDINNKNGQYPHDLAMGERRQQLLQYHEDCQLEKLLKLGGVVSLKIVKGYVVGSSKAGKTTFSLAVSNTGDATNVSEYTVGIDIFEIKLEKIGYLKLHDVAGQDLYHTTHTFFFGGVSSIFIYLVDTDRSKDNILSDAIYWLALITSGRLPAYKSPYLLILGSRGGDRDQKARQVKLNSVARQLMKKFAGRFVFLMEGKSLVLDMRLSDSKEMKEVKEWLSTGVKRCLERTANVPVVCLEVQRHVLSPLRQETTSCQFIDKSNFHALVTKLFHELLDPSLYSSLLFFLEEFGDIVDVGTRLVINPLWLCRSLFAAVFSSTADPASAEFSIRMNAKPDGTATLEDIATVLEDFRELMDTPAVDPDAGIDVLCEMGLALPTEIKNVYRFPALIQDEKPERIWMKKECTSVPSECSSKYNLLFLIPILSYTCVFLQAVCTLAFVFNVSPTLRSSLQLLCLCCREK
jgi:ankyrin repeat protein